MALIQSHVLRLVLLLVFPFLALLLLQGGGEGVEVPLVGSRNSLLAKVELADERGKLARLEGGRKEGQRLLELRGQDGAWKGLYIVKHLCNKDKWSGSKYP